MEHDLSAIILDFAGKILQKQRNYHWIPDWLTGVDGIDGCVVGVMAAQHCLVYFSSQDRKSEKNADMYTADIELNTLQCGQQHAPGKQNMRCGIIDCPVRRMAGERYGPGRAVACFSIAGRKGFIMVCGEDVRLNSRWTTELMKAVANLFERSLDADQSAGNRASYFLPPDDMAQMWSEMLAGLSHDLRTPLACIKGYVTTLLREDVTWDPAEQNEFLNIIVEETDHIERLIDNLLDASTLSWKGEIELKKEPVLLSQIVGKVLRDQSYLIKNHQFTVSFPEDFPFIEADPVRIEQVLRNLVDNAVKYSKDNTTIVIKGELLPGEVVVSVADQGIGIGDEHLNRLFEKFFRVSEGIREHQKGMGLGLPLARQILNSHGGRIWAKSKLNQGTTFYFTLPVSASGE